MKQNQSPDWRWVRVRRLTDNELTPRRSRDDHFVHAGWRFNKRLRRLDLKAEDRLANDYPDLYNAFKIYDDNQSGVRWVFEASVMANRPIAELAEYLHTDEAVLAMYEAMFFDVREALAHRGCIVSNILMPMATNSVSPRDPDVFWKSIAYYGGWDAVKSSWEIGHATPEALDFYNKANRQKLIKNAYDALHTLRITEESGLEFVKSMHDQRRIDIESDTPESGDLVHLALNSMLTAIAINVTPTRAKLPQEEPRLQDVVIPAKIKDVEGSNEKDSG